MAPHHAVQLDCSAASTTAAGLAARIAQAAHGAAAHRGVLLAVCKSHMCITGASAAATSHTARLAGSPVSQLRARAMLARHAAHHAATAISRPAAARAPLGVTAGTRRLRCCCRRTPTTVPHAGPPHMGPLAAPVFKATGVPLVEKLLGLPTLEAAARHSLRLVAAAAAGAALGCLVLCLVDRHARERLEERATFDVLAAAVVACLEPAQARACPCARPAAAMQCGGPAPAPACLLAADRRCPPAPLARAGRCCCRSTRPTTARRWQRRCSKWLPPGWTACALQGCAVSPAPCCTTTGSIVARAAGAACAVGAAAAAAASCCRKGQLSVSLPALRCRRSWRWGAVA